MDAGGKRTPVAPGVKQNRNAVSRGRRGDFFYLGDPAGAGDVGLKVINRAANHEILEGVAHIQVFTDGDGNFPSLPKLGMAGNVFNKEGLLKPEDATVGKSRRRIKSNLQRVALVRVGHHDKVFAEFRTHRADDSNILIQIEADFDLYAMKTLLGKSPRSFRHL